MTVLPVPSLLSPPVLAELQQADLITSEECRGLDDSSDVVRVQRGKSPEVQSKTAVVLRSHGYTKVSDHLTSKQALPLTMCLWCVVQWSLVVFRCEVHVGTAIAWYVDPSSIPPLTMSPLLWCTSIRAMHALCRLLLQLVAVQI